MSGLVKIESGEEITCMNKNLTAQGYKDALCCSVTDMMVPVRSDASTVGFTPETCPF